ncbi:MAG: glutamate--tRNA ligase family protein [Bdellovibrionales bacterium]
MSVRFAPSPTGAFHVGNFRTAWISFQWARLLRQPWVVRFEDIDTPRVVAGSQQQQLDEMLQLGLKPDRVLKQSERRQRHWQLFQTALQQKMIYPCHCSRKEVLASLASAPHGKEAVYSGRCRHGTLDTPSGPSIAWRFCTPEVDGRGDFIIARTSPDGSEASFVPAYHWACAVDDWEEGHKLLVRAWDLADATTVQRHLQKWLRGNEDKPLPAVYHTALVTLNNGQRLEKRTANVTWQELNGLGFGPSKLQKIFSESFSAHFEEFEYAKVWGEIRRSVSLDELGFT